jgi:hypothetical protein
MVELSVDDIRQMYVDNIVSYKGEFVKVRSVNAEGLVSIIRLGSGKQSTVKFNRQDFSSPRKRIGYINHNCHAIYISRVPVRRYGVGINRGNTKTMFHETDRYKPTFVRALDQVARFDSKSWDDTLNNEYPSLRSALSIAARSGGSCAFDRQFAVDDLRYVYYKSIYVGKIAPRYYTPQRIEFNEQFSFLSVLMELNNENTVRTFEAA